MKTQPKLLKKNLLLAMTLFFFYPSTHLLTAAHVTACQVNRSENVKRWCKALDNGMKAEKLLHALIHAKIGLPEHTEAANVQLYAIQGQLSHSRLQAKSKQECPEWVTDVFDTYLFKAQRLLGQAQLKQSEKLG